MAAYLLDWLISLCFAGALVLAAAALILAATGLDRHSAPGWATYASGVILAAWLPFWLIYTSLFWSIHGATPGMMRMRLMIVDSHGRTPSVWRAAWRALALACFSLPVLGAPALGAIALSIGGAIAVWILVPGAVLAIVAAASCCHSVWRRHGQLLHDRLSGTCVVLRKPSATVAG